MASTDQTDTDDDSALLLKASAKRLFETLMEQTPDGIYIKDRKSRFVACSQQLAKSHGFNNRHDLEGMTDFDLFSIEHAQQAFNDEQEILRTEKPIINKVEKETWRDRESTWVSTTKSPLYLGSGKLVGIIGISRDITEQTTALEKLAESEKLLREQNDVMRADYESANHVQSIMIPGRVPKVEYLNLGYLWKPMTSVGGDIISFPRNPRNCLLFYMGDVCGHGVTAAFYTVLLKYLTAHAAETYTGDPRVFLSEINEEITGRINNGFVTGLAGHFGQRQKDGSRKLFLSHSGHRQVLIYRSQSKSIEIITQANGTVMGIPGSEPSEVCELVLEQNDRFYAFTDGISEASDRQGEEFGLARLVHLFEKFSTEPIEETLESVFDQVTTYTGLPQQQDDITLLGFQLD